MKRRLAALVILATAGALALVWPVTGDELDGKKRKVTKTDEEWAKQLTQEQFLVTRRKATEPAFSGKLFDNHAAGTYVCVCCGADLFSSKAKFDSGTGWPSFWKPIDRKRIDTAPDFKMAEPRVEVMCNDCGSHLGHVFEDGPAPTYLRFCLNSASLKFVKDASATKAKAKAKAKGKTKGEAPEEKAESKESGEANAPASGEKAPQGASEKGR